MNNNIKIIKYTTRLEGCKNYIKAKRVTESCEDNIILSILGHYLTNIDIECQKYQTFLYVTFKLFNKSVTKLPNFLLYNIVNRLRFYKN